MKTLLTTAFLVLSLSACASWPLLDPTAIKEAHHGVLEGHEIKVLGLTERSFISLADLQFTVDAINCRGAAVVLAMGGANALNLSILSPHSYSGLPADEVKCQIMKGSFWVNILPELEMLLRRDI